MGKRVKDPKEIIPDVIADYQGVFGDDLVSILLYGSAAGPGFRPGKSDINFMVVLTEAGIDHLDRAFDSVAKWRKRAVAVPLFLTETYLGSSLDVFPIEYLSFQRKYVVVYGKDVLNELVFDPELLRLQCEREIKGKLLILREAFLETSGRAKDLRAVMTRSIEAFVAVFEALLYLGGEAIPEDKRDIIRSACKTFERNEGVFERLLDVKEDRIGLSQNELLELFKDYLREVRELSKQVDLLGG
jgi:hypothetical protein